MEAALDARTRADAATGVTDWIEMVRFVGPQFKDAGWPGIDRLNARLNDPANAAAVDAARSALGSSYSAFSTHVDLFIGSSGNDVVSNLGDNDTLLGGLGNDAIIVSGNNNLVDGGAGNDTLTSGYNVNTTIDGGAGDDLIQANTQNYGYNANANTISGGAGNDRMLMGGTADTYLFNRGDGQDTINDQGSNYWGQAVGAEKIGSEARTFDCELCTGRVYNRLVQQENDRARRA